jgi:hypothetical protein
VTESRVLTQEELWAEAKERFGESPLDWAFQCTGCKDIATGLEFRDALAEHPRKHRELDRNVLFTDVFGQECIGRILGKGADRGCMYAAYGLIHGPWQVAVQGRTKPMYCFALAPAPAPAAEAGDA